MLLWLPCASNIIPGQLLAACTESASNENTPLICAGPEPCTQDADDLTMLDANSDQSLAEVCM